MTSRVNDRLVADSVAAVGAGGLRYAPRQLYYAVCARLERPPASVGDAQLGCGALMVVGAVVGGILLSIYFSLVVPVGMVLFGMGVQARRAERNRPTERPLALSYDEFLREVVSERRLTQPSLFADMLGEGVHAPDDSGDDSAPLVVCDHPETAALLRANVGIAGFAVRALDEHAAEGRVAGARVVAVHDADPQGCGLAARLLRAGAAEVVDLGLRPGHIGGRRIQVIQGAPVVVGADSGALLSPEEVVWLAEGRRVEIAILSPQELIGSVRAAVAPGAPTATPPGAPAGLLVSGVRLIAVEDSPVNNSDAED